MQMRNWSVLVLVATVAITLAACGGIDTGQLEDEVSKDAEEQLGSSGVSVESVSCPDDIKSETGETFECQLELSDGSSATAAGEVTDGDNGDVEYRFSSN
jgi:hypothetical protein